MTFARSCNPIWQTLLPAAAGTEATPESIAILGVGNEFNGDDAAGVELVRLAAPGFAGRAGILVLEGGLAPQNFTGVLRRFQPTRVVIVDAADMGLSPGAVERIDPAEIDGLSSSTHTFPLSLLAQYLEAELGCQVAIIGIQPAACEAFTPLSAPVSTAVQVLAASLFDALA